jgi:hypothetical protein
MRRSFGGRVSALAGGMLVAVALVAFASPAVAQVPPGAQAAVFVGGPVANCPPGSPGALVPAGGTINGVIVSGAGRCTPLSADAEGSYSVGGSSPLTFTSQCANVGGTVQHSGGVEVPGGTIVNGVSVGPNPTVITAENASAIFPGGRTATLNVVSSTPTSLTRTAIVFTGGPSVGQVICGAAAYPLAVSAGASGEAAAVVELPSSGGDGGGIGTALLGAGALALVVLAQVVVGRRVRGRRGDATA